jgi:putative membrane protein (TIGR04086 family)
LKTYAVSIVKALAVSYVISAASLLVLTGLLYMLDIQENQIQLGMVVTYIASCLIGGFYVGRKIRKREFLWGMVTGLLYYCIHVAVVVALEGMQPWRMVPGTALILLCMGSGMMGGMLS